MPEIDYNTKIALITGASSGIGEAAAIFFAHKGIHVILTARRMDRLRQLEAKITKSGGVSTIIKADLSLETERLKLRDTLLEKNLMPDILVNNAGLAWYGYFQEMPWAIARDIIILNIEAATHLTILLLPSMLQKKFGRVIIIGSIAGKMPEQGIGVYSASKAYLDAFTTSIHRDLKRTGVSVTVIRAGPVKTEVFDTARSLENGGNVPAERFAIPAENVAKTIWKAVKRPSRVIYVPFYLVLSPLLEFFFSSIIDQVGPLLLRRGKKTND